MFKRPTFTIIIPVFKTEKFLEQCLHSLLSQTFEDFECLIINDGSPGCNLNSWFLLQDWFWQPKITPLELYKSNIYSEHQAQFITSRIVREDKRFRYFEQSNSGVSSARNFGLAKAQGYFVVFVDSDDWIQKNHLSNIYFSIISSAKKPKFLYSKIESAYNTTRKITRPTPKSWNLANLTYCHAIWTWNSVYGLDFIHRHNLLFDSKLGYGSTANIISTKKEDVLFNYDHFYALEQDHGQLSNIEFITFPQTYMYRDVNKTEKQNADKKLNGEVAFSTYIQNKYSNKKISPRTKIALKLNHLKQELNSKNHFLEKPVDKVLKLLSGY